MQRWPVTGAGRSATATSARSCTSTLNLTAHEVRANAAAVLLDANNQFSIFNPAATVDVVIDVAGRFDAPSSAANALTGPSALRPFTPKAGVARRQPA